MNTKDIFIDELVNIQQSNHYSDSKMAELIGCSRQLYQATRQGKVSVGIKILRGGLNAFPQLRNVGVIFASMDDAPTPHQKPLKRFWGALGRLFDALIEGMK